MTRTEQTTRSQGDDWMAQARCRPLSVVLFTRQLALLFKGGVPLAAALHGLVGQEEARFSAVVDKLTALVSEGHTFSAALARFPRIFNRVYVTMIAVGEQTGGLHRSLDTLADWIERDSEWSQRIRSAMAYPAFIIALTCGMTFMLFHSVMPGFLRIFTDMKIELPLVTQIVVSMSKAASNPGVWVLTLAALGFLTVTVREYGRTERGAVNLFRWLSRVPGLGALVESASLARYSCALGTMLGGGAEIMASLKMAAQASNNPILMADSTHLVTAVTEGERISHHMLNHPEVYSAILANMARVGEESARLDKMFLKVADYYAHEVEHLVNSLGAALEPLLLAMVGTVVGFVVLALFLPMYSNLAQLGT